MAIDFPRSTYTAAEGVSAESWPASPSDGDTQTNGAGDNFTFIGARSLWVLNSGRTHTITPDGATYSWDLEKWIAQSHIPFRYHGPKPSDPTGMSSGDEGDLYYNTVANEMRVYNGSSWDTITSVGDFNILTLSASSTAAPVGGTASFDGTATRFQLSETPNVAQQLLISINGVVQEPQAGTSPTEGFAVDGNDIIFASAPATGSTFFGVQMGAEVNIGTPSDNTVTNAKVATNAAIAGSKIDPDFGSQDIVTTGEIGIGTTSPGASLDIDDSAASSGTKSLKLNIADNTAEAVHIAQGSNEYLSIDTTNSSELITIGNTTTKPDVIVPDGSVGIGTTTLAASSRLTLIEKTGNAQTLEIKGANATGVGSQPGIKFTASGGDNIGGIYGDTNSDVVHIQTGGSERITINSSGRVGIGTTSPLSGSQLTVASGCLAVTGQNTEHSANSLRIGEEGSGVAQLRAYGPNTSTRGSFEFTLSTSDGLSPVRTVIDSSGNVGIGTTGPSTRLHVSGASGTAFTLDGANDYSSTASIFMNQGRSEIRTTINASGGNPGGSLLFRTRNNSGSLVDAVTIDSNQTVTINSAAGTNPLVVGDGGTEAMRIDSSGRLLVGTTSALTAFFGTAVEKLAIGGGASPQVIGAYSANQFGPRLDLIKSRSSTVNGQTIVQENDGLGEIYFGGSDGTAPIPAARIVAQVDGTPAGPTPGPVSMPGRLVFSTTADGASSPTERMRIGSAGNTRVEIKSGLYFHFLNSGAGNSTLKYNTITGLVSYDTSSRLVKEQIIDCPYGIAELKQLQPRKYFRTDDQAEEIGFIADELVQVMPEFVPIGPKSLITKNEDDTEEIPLGVNYEKLTSVLTKVLQEAIAKIETLEAEVAALKSN